jgi:UDP-2-acetamido-3-amino-2,3-dideoxy-glucuronate N-acetyltransferase
MNHQFTQDNRGSLGVIDFHDIPFHPQRMFWMCDVPEDETRGNHAHRSCEQFIVVLTGTLTARIDLVSGSSSTYQLVAGGSLYLGVHQWLVLSNFSTDCTIAVLASEPYNEEEYIRSRSEFDSLKF